MAEVQPLKTLRYEQSVVGPLDDVIAPPYDVIDAELRAQLVARSPYNVVEIDLPVEADEDDRYLHAETLLDHWRTQGALVQEDEPAFWALDQEYTAPAASQQRRRATHPRRRGWT